MGNFDMKIEKKIGKRTYEFIVNGNNLHEAVMESKKLSFYDVHKCGCCGSDDLVLDAHVAQNKFEYTTIKCNKCKASVNFGQQQKDKEVFYVKTRAKKDGTGKEIDWTPYSQSGDVNQVSTQQQSTQQQVQNYTEQNPGQNPQGGYRQ